MTESTETIMTVILVALTMGLAACFVATMVLAVWIFGGDRGDD